jgi:hypothetical protein
MTHEREEAARQQEATEAMIRMREPRPAPERQMRMTVGRYARVIPRDLFNEASLLKCYGKLTLELERRRTAAALDEDALKHDPFDIRQDQSDGSISILNLPFTVRGVPFRLYRPLNSREPWPLWCESPFACDEEDLEVFTAEGELSPAFLELIGAEAPTRPLPPVERGMMKASGR